MSSCPFRSWLGTVASSLQPHVSDRGRQLSAFGLEGTFRVASPVSAGPSGFWVVPSFSGRFKVASGRGLNKRPSGTCGRVGTTALRAGTRVRSPDAFLP